jgi:hypothetical protein
MIQKDIKALIDRIRPGAKWDSDCAAIVEILESVLEKRGCENPACDGCRGEK